MEEKVMGLALYPRIGCVPFSFGYTYETHLYLQHHIADHPTHAKNRHARVKAELAAKRNKGSVVSCYHYLS